MLSTNSFISTASFPETPRAHPGAVASEHVFKNYDVDAGRK